jgi:hypothetical protein
MKAIFIVFVAAAAIVTLSHAEQAQEQLDPAIPRDKCGVTIAVNENERPELFILGADKAYYHLVSFLNRAC